jgi:hypothetical protein
MVKRLQSKGLNQKTFNFVYGDKAPISAAEPVEERIEPIVETVPTVADSTEPIVAAVAIAVASKPISPQPTTSLMSRLMQNTPEKEATVRLTVDLPKSTHTKLSILCAQNGLKKAEVVRMLLDDALKDTNT